jgi:hypothetical protein
MLHKNSKLYKSIPIAIRPLVTQCNIFGGEDPKEYFDLLAALIERFKPKSITQWLNVKKLQDSIWEQFRLSRIKPAVIESAQISALKSVLELLPAEVKEALPGNKMPIITDRHIGLWFCNKEMKKKMEEILELFNCSQNTIDAVAFIKRSEVSATIDKMQASMETREFMLCRQIEAEQQVLELTFGDSKEPEKEVSRALARADNNNDEDLDHESALEAGDKNEHAEQAEGEADAAPVEAELVAEEGEDEHCAEQDGSEEDADAEQAKVDEEDGEHVEARENDDEQEEAA